VPEIRTAGIDIGSRTIKLLVSENGVFSEFCIADTGHDPLRVSQRLLAYARHVDRVVATGYGRYLAKEHFAGNAITEIKACALGANYVFPKCRTVIDVGGQDSKIIRVDGNGRFEDFEMNDKCAAGTGRFLEVMARTLSFGIEEFGQEAMKAQNPVRIDSTCTVFSESEAVSLLANGEDRRNVALGVHQAIVARLASMVKRVGLKEDVVFAGGVAKNPCITSLLEKGIGATLFIPEEPQMLGALGALLTIGSYDMRRKEARASLENIRKCSLGASVS
jgi:predicted CoA-substrate-specific enzyme activase